MDPHVQRIDVQETVRPGALASMPLNEVRFRTFVTVFACRIRVA